MHDCLKTKEDLIDLVFGEATAEVELRMLEGVEACRTCRAEYRSMKEALAGFDEAAAAAAPADNFWTDYHASLEERLKTIAGADNNVIPFWRRALSASFRVPAPLAAAAAILFVALSVLAVRSLMTPAVINQRTNEATAAAGEVRFVEVPVEKRVVEEKVVTRTVYVARPAARVGNQPAPSVRDLQEMTARQSKDESNPVRSSLNGFQPPGDVKLTVIKGSFDDEK
jgi:anti-sigma factor RsiW